MELFPTPKQLGLPPEFRSWRKNQPKAIQDILECQRRCIIQSQRQGEGKSVTYIAAALMNETKRWAFLTSTKGLQDQNLEKFEGIGLSDIRGKSSYNCDAIPGATCQEGCVSKCFMSSTSMCDWNRHRIEACTARMVQTNYSCWISSYRYGRGFGDFDVLVCDEAHAIPGEVEKAISVHFGEHEIGETLGREWPERADRDDMKVWKHWALVGRSMAQREVEHLKEQIDACGKRVPSKLAKKYTQFKNLATKLAEVGTCNAERWVVDVTNNGYRFDPVDTAPYVEKLLFRGIPKLVLQSGTITPHMVEEQMGIEMNDVKFFEYYAHVNPARTPIMYIPTSSVNRYAEPWQLRKIVKRIDEIFESRMDRKGIVHTSNGKLRDFIMANSKWASRYYVSNYPDRGDQTSAIIEQFKDAPAPRLFISPSVTTGYDFPHDMCRYQIVAKLNYANQGSKIEKARQKLDPERSAGHVILTLQQSVGRGDRAPDDWQEVFIIDDAFPTLKWKHESLFSPMFLACCKTVERVPKAPPLDWEA